MLCFSVDSPDSLENVESKWVGEIAENCPGVKLVLVALKCDLREQKDDEDTDAQHEPKRPMIDYKAGLAVAEKIKALRYLGELKLPSSLRHVSKLADKSFEVSHTNPRPNRMLRDEEPWSERGFHRSSTRGITGQERQGRQVG